MDNQVLPLPNPTDWMTMGAAAFLLGVSRMTVVRMIRQRTLTAYRPYGAPKEQAPPMLWRPEVNRVLDARLTLRATQRAARVSEG